MAADHDVFLSFRGVDTRSGFTSHVYLALREKGIKTFIDNILCRGEYVTELFSAIKRSRICIVIFSINYAGSIWCLNELAQMILDKEIIVLPIFYRVSPSDVRRQTGHVGNHFKSNEKIRNSGLESIGRWRNALKELGSISGWEVTEMTNEAELIQLVVYQVSEILQSLAAYNRRIHIQPAQTANPTNSTLAAPDWGTCEMGWYNNFFGDANKLNKPLAIPMRKTLVSAAIGSSSHNSVTSQARLDRRSSSDQLIDQLRNAAANGRRSQTHESRPMTKSQATSQARLSTESTTAVVDGRWSHTYDIRPMRESLRTSQARLSGSSSELTVPSTSISGVSSIGSSLRSQRSETSRMTESLTSSSQPVKVVKIRLHVEADLIVHVPVRKDVHRLKKYMVADVENIKVSTKKKKDRK